MLEKIVDDKNICFDCKSHLDIIADKINLPSVERDFLKKPKRVFSFSIPLKTDSGEARFFNGYRVQYSDALGPTKGGIRFHQHVNLEEVKTLSFLMALKCSLLGLPFGGAKGGIEVNPETLSNSELERLSRGYIREIHNFIGPEIDIPAPDVNTNEKIMAWMVDEYSIIKGKFVPGVVTGKPLELGGSKGRAVATGLGGAYILREFIQKEKWDSSKIKIVVQGFGNVGFNIVKILDEWGYKIIALGDAEKSIYNKEGLNIKEIISKQKKEGIIPEISGVEKISNKELLELECDVLIPAAISHQITKENVHEIKAKVILEMANAPIAPKVDSILIDKKIKVIPDILSNSGGVVVSYFEWIQNSTNEYWSEKEVFDKLEKRMVEAFNLVYFSGQSEKNDLRTSAHIIAIKRIIKAEKLRGNL